MGTALGPVATACFSCPAKQDLVQALLICLARCSCAGSAFIVLNFHVNSSGTFGGASGESMFITIATGTVDDGEIAVVLQ